MLDNYDWRAWLRGLLVATVSGGANAVVNAFGLNMSDPEHFNRQSGNFIEIMWTMFGTSAALALFLYLKQSPLPPIISKTTTTTTVEKTEVVSSTPPAAAQEPK